jgi:glycosyltransferase involved in cell wall biosynthesis
MLQKPTDLDASSILWEQKKIQYARLHLSVVGCSKWISDLAVASGLLSGAKVLSIPNPIDTTRFTPKEKFALRKSKGIAEDAFVVLFGAMSLKDKRKGFHLLQASLQHLKQTRPDIDPLLVVIGKSEPQLTELLPYRIHYGGMVQEEEIADWYALSDVMALSSMQDNLPNTVMEALACGVPVVAYAIGGIPEMIRHGFNGMLVPAFDTQEFAKALAKLIDSDRTAMEVSARAWVMEHYSYSTVVASYQQVYASSMTARS